MCMDELRFDGSMAEHLAHPREPLPDDVAYVTEWEWTIFNDPLNDIPCPDVLEGE